MSFSPGSAAALLVVASFILAGCVDAAESEAATAQGVDAWLATAADSGCRPFEGLDHDCLSDGLGPGEAVFWDGRNIPGGDGVGPIGSCQATGACHAYVLPVGQAGSDARLRVALQMYLRDPNVMRPFADGANFGPETDISLSLFPPGASSAIATVSGTGTFAAEAFVDGANVRAGDWRIHLQGMAEQSDILYRMRATIEAQPEHEDGLALPDLQIIPPFEIGFALPTLTVMAGVPVPVGSPAANCMAEEYAEVLAEGLEPPVMCLRFSMGLANGGPGGFWVRELPRDGIMEDLERAAGLQIMPIVQVACDRNFVNCQDLELVDGLEARYHMFHYHHHYQNAYIYDLYAVGAADARGVPELTKVGTSGKLGLNPTNEVMLDWHEFYQAPRSWRSPDNPGGSIVAQIQAGWGDIYDWNRSGNYVNFPVEASGLPVVGEYVIRGTTDPDSQIVESNEDNNQGYAYFRVSALGTVELIERGLGADPWDPMKEPAEVAP